MGSIFFDLEFLSRKKVDTIFCKVDKSNTPNPRGKNFKDPGGYGLIKFNDNKKLLFDLRKMTTIHNYN